MSDNKQVPFIATDYDIWFIVRDGSVFTSSFHNMVALFYDLFVLIFVHAYTIVPCQILPQFPCICGSVVEHSLSYLFVYCSFANIGHADIMWFIIILLIWPVYAACFCFQYLCCINLIN
jgi:hypothetical protein